jgi:hypothetical protein
LLAIFLEAVGSGPQCSKHGTMKDVKSKLTVYTGNLITRSDPLDGWTNASWLREIELTVTKFDVVKVAVVGSCSCMLVLDDSGFVRMEGSPEKRVVD